MATQIYTFKITYGNCDNRIWRVAAVSSNYTLAQLGYLVLATFDTMAYHLFEMRYKSTRYFLTEEDLEELPWGEDEKCGLLGLCKVGQLGMGIGDVMEMIYDWGCHQKFKIVLLKIDDMQKNTGRAYPKILDGAGRGIVDDMPAYELLDAIREIDAGGHSGIQYSSEGFEDVPEWDYRNYSLDSDNCLLRGTIERIRDGYEEYDEE